MGRLRSWGAFLARRLRGPGGLMSPVLVLVLAAGLVVPSRGTPPTAQGPSTGSPHSTAPSPAPTAPAPSSAAPAGSGCVVDTSTVIGWWPGDGTAAGRIGPGLTGSPSYTTAEVRQGFSLDGTGPLVTDQLPVVSSAVSVEAWIRPQATGIVQAIFSRFTWPGGGSEDSYLLMLSPSGGLWWATDDPSTMYPIPVEATVPQLFDGQFHHVAATWSTTSTDLYVDGTRVASTRSFGASVNPATTTTFGIGGSPGSGMAFKGVIDEPTVYHSALSASDIAAIYAAGSAGKCGAWTQQATLVGADALPGDGAGNAVAVDGDTAVVGAYGYSTTSQAGRGAAYVYIRSGTTWAQQALLAPAGLGAGDAFGWSVAISGDTVVVGAHQHTVNGDVSAGATYVYVRTGTTWALQATLTAPTPASGDQFGSSVAISGNTVLVGASATDVAAVGTDAGAAYVFTRSGTTWSQQARVTGSAAYDEFGTSVALSGTTALIGAFNVAPRDPSSADGSCCGQGAAYVLTGSGSSWVSQATLRASDGQGGDFFGYTVALDGDTAVVGAYNAPVGAVYGAAYVFTRTGSTWSQQAKLTSDAISTSDFFGWAVAVSGDSVVVGAPAFDGSGVRAAYGYTRSGSTWFADGPVTGSGGPNDAFGYSVAVIGSTALVGAPLADSTGVASGKAFAFVR